MESAGAKDMPDEVERKGLGTPATRAGVIEKLVRIGFVERQEILLHKAAKNAFDELHLKKLPKVEDLSVEYAEILAKKKKLYGEYRQAKKDMQEIQRAKYDIDQFFKSDEDQKKKRVRKHNITR